MLFATNKSVLKLAPALLPAGTRPIEAQVGRRHFAMTQAGWIYIGVFCVAFLAALVAGRVLFPGAILVLGFFTTTMPWRSVVVADKGVAVFYRSVWTGKPKKVLALLPHSALSNFTQPPTAKKVKVQMGDEVITFRGKHYQKLWDALPPQARERQAG